MKIANIIYAEEGEHYNREIISEINDGIQTMAGTVILKKGTRIPLEGFSRHPFNEISIIIKGNIEMIDEAGEILGYLTAGTMAYLNALEPQAGNVLEDTELIYMINKLI